MQPFSSHIWIHQLDASFCRVACFALQSPAKDMDRHRHRRYLFGLSSWVHYTFISEPPNVPYQLSTKLNITFRNILQTWSTGTVPQSFRGCDARVEPQQAFLFLADTYNTQFARTMYNHSNHTQPSRVGPAYLAFDMELSRSIQMNQTLCNQGFAGNTDLYGLGIRTGLYLQWISSLLANNLLPKICQQLQSFYLIFSSILCLATFIKSFAKDCVFSIEIEIMYWMYWGGFVCVFASAPCPAQLGSEMKWIKLNWTDGILFTTHILMTYHGIWFVLYAYDQVFSRMPCGTYQFFLVPMLDPSESFWALRDYLTHLMVPWVPALMAVFPFVGLLLASEIKHSIQHSAIYQWFILRSKISDCDQAQTTGLNASAKTSLGLRIYLSIKQIYRKFQGIIFRRTEEGEFA